MKSAWSLSSWLLAFRSSQVCADNPTAQHRYPKSTQCVGRSSFGTWGFGSQAPLRRQARSRRHVVGGGRTLAPGATSAAAPALLDTAMSPCAMRSSLARPATAITTELPLHHRQDMRRRDLGPPTATTGTTAQRLGRPRQPGRRPASTAAKEGFSLRDNALMAPCCPATLTRGQGRRARAEAFNKSM